MTNVLGPDIHIKSINKIHLVQFDTGGVFGWILTQTEVVSQFLSGDPNLCYGFTRFLLYQPI